jgi:hypothetical protein
MYACAVLMGLSAVGMAVIIFTNMSVSKLLRDGAPAAACANYYRIQHHPDSKRTRLLRIRHTSSCRLARFGVSAQVGNAAPLESENKIFQKTELVCIGPQKILVPRTPFAAVLLWY